jgi:hypothetical protein
VRAFHRFTLVDQAGERVFWFGIDEKHTTTSRFVHMYKMLIFFPVALIIGRSLLEMKSH